MNRDRFGKIKFKTKYNVNYLFNKFMMILMLLYVFIPPYLNQVFEEHNLIKKILLMQFLILMIFILIVSTIINKGDVYNSIVSFILVIFLSLFTVIASENDEMSELLLYSIRDITVIIFFINTIIY